MRGQSSTIITVIRYTPMVTSALGTLYEMIAQPDARSQENRDATENAISAIVKAVINMPGVGATLNDALPQILDWLPIVSDAEEANYVYTQVIKISHFRLVIFPSFFFFYPLF